jgi:hypothetical protein
VKAPAFVGPAQEADDHSVNGAVPPAHQGLADFIDRCASLGWHVEAISHRLLKLTAANDSVLLASADPVTYPDSIRRIADANDFAKRHRRP